MVGSQAKLRAPQSPAVPARKLIIKPLKSAPSCAKQCLVLRLPLHDIKLHRRDMPDMGITEGAGASPQLSCQAPDDSLYA